MSSEQQQHQHPLDKRLQAVIDEYQSFSSTAPQDQIFKEILELRAALLRSYDENDYATNLQALEVETAQLYSEIDVSQADAVQLERQAKISALRVAIEEDKKAVRSSLDSSPDTRMAYLIGVASHFPLNDSEYRDELMELISEIDSLYESIREMERGVKSLYVLDGEIREATAKEIYQEFFSRTQPLRSPDVEIQEQSDAASEVSDISFNSDEVFQDVSLDIHHQENFPELGDEAQERLNELSGFTYGNPLFNEQEARRLEQEANLYSKPLPPTPPNRKLKDEPLSAREQMLNKLDEKLAETDKRMRGIANNIDKATEEKVIDRDWVFYFEATIESNLYRKIKEYLNASVEDRVQIQIEIERLLDDLNNHYYKNTETYTGVLEAGGPEASIDSHIEAENTKLRQDIDPYLQVAPLADASNKKSVAQVTSINEETYRPLPTAPERKIKLMDKVKASPVPSAPMSDELRAAIEQNIAPDSQENVHAMKLTEKPVKDAKLADAKTKKPIVEEMLKKLADLKTSLLDSHQNKIKTYDVNRLREALAPLLKFLIDNRDNPHLTDEMQKIKSDVNEVQTGIKNYLQATSGVDRKIIRAVSNIKKSFTHDTSLSSREEIKKTRDEIEKTIDEVSSHHFMTKPR